jgi:transposase-like protein
MQIHLLVFHSPSAGAARQAVASALKDIYRATDDLAAATALDAFEAGPWRQKYPAIEQSWRRAWPEVIPFYVFLPMFAESSTPRIPSKR